jgi:serine/threonine-protein kinase RsbT
MIRIEPKQASVSGRILRLLLCLWRGCAQNMSDICIHIRTEDDVYIALHSVRLLLKQLSFSEMDTQKVIVSVSELTRNVLDHADAKGYFTCSIVDGPGLRFIIQDFGRGLEAPERIMSGEKRSKSRGLGLGLAGAKRMMDDFQIKTSKEGTTIVCTKWRGSYSPRT